MNTNQPQGKGLEAPIPTPTNDQDEILLQNTLLLETLLACLDHQDQARFTDLVIRGLDKAYSDPQAREQIRRVLTRPTSNHHADQLREVPGGLGANLPPNTV
jgi:hypothetical protein